MPPLVIYITGFRQHAGKTVTSLGLLSLLRRRFDPKDLGYLKPVGQEMVSGPDGQLYDKDAAVLKQFSGIPDLVPLQCSPVRLTSGFTKQYMDLPPSGQADVNVNLRAYIESSLGALSHKKIIVAEGTGHPGVGGIVGLSNAEVSNLLRAETIFLSGGGIGKAMDQLEVDLSYFLYKKSRVRGVLFNKVIPDKLEQTKKFLNEEFLNRRYRFETPLRVFGYLPTVGDLGKPSMRIIREAFGKDVEVLAEGEAGLWELPTNHLRIITVPEEYLDLDSFLQPQDIVLIGAGSRNRLAKILDYQSRQKPGEGLGGLILTCGRMTGRQEASRALVSRANFPVLYVQDDTAATEAVLRDTFENTKLQTFDVAKVSEIETLFAEHFAFDTLLEVMGL